MTRRLFFAVLAGVAVQRRDPYRMTRAVIMALHGATLGADGVYYVHYKPLAHVPLRPGDQVVIQTVGSALSPS